MKPRKRLRLDAPHPLGERSAADPRSDGWKRYGQLMMTWTHLIKRLQPSVYIDLNRPLCRACLRGPRGKHRLQTPPTAVMWPV
jgi:hypothetical protein